MKLLLSEPAEGAGAPGTVLDDRLTVACGDGRGAAPRAAAGGPRGAGGGGVPARAAGGGGRAARLTAAAGCASLLLVEVERGQAMRATRRAVSFGLLAAAAVVAGLRRRTGGRRRRGAHRRAGRCTPVPNAGFDAWVAGFRSRALAQGISPATFDAAFAQAGFLPGVIERDRNQTEFTRTLEDYLAIAASDERVTKGRAALGALRRDAGGDRGALRRRAGGGHRGLGDGELLRRAAGQRAGGLGAGDAGLRGAAGSFFESQLVAALKILQNGDVTPCAA